MNKKNKKSFELIKEIIELPKLNEVLNNTEKEQLETEIYRILIDIELNEKILADKNKWIVELLNEIEELRKINKNYISKDKIKNFFEERLLKYTEADDGIYDKPYLTRGELELVDRYGECKEIAEILLAEKIEIPKESISKDKIRDKIKQLEKEKNLYFEKQVMQGKIDLLKELLEE